MEGFGFIIGIVIMLLMLGVGLAVGLLMLAALAALVSLGVVSSSVIVGFWKRRTLAGVQAFLVQCGVLAGAPTGAACAWAAWHVWPSIHGDAQVLLAGAIGGATGGLLIAWLASTAASHIAKNVWPWLCERVTCFQDER
jgi:hypothetical protein